MPWCPKCGAQYREGFTRCSECGVELTADPPSAAPVGPEWVTVATFASDEEAALARGFLIGRGLQAEILDQQMHIQPYGTVIMGEISLMVPPEEEERARALLAEVEGGDTALDAGDGSESPDEGGQNGE